MKCPVCNVELQMTERQGVEIDYCQQCRGVWLDRGELDKIIERSNQIYSGPHLAPTATRDYPQSPTNYASGAGGDDYGGQYRPDDRRYQDDYRGERGRDYDEHFDREGRPKRKRESFLSELFDFD